MIEAIYRELKKLGAVRNRDQFSSEWLGMERSYMRVLRSKQRQPSAKAMARCAARLRRESMHISRIDMRGFGMAAAKLGMLADSCMDDIMERATCDLTR